MMGSKHIPYNIEGVKVMFPFKPYDTQMDYMRNVVKAIKNKQNAILESPTGTGKTLSLLCATMGWLSAQNGASNTIIYYVSRTHTQITQVAKELKSSAYSRVPSVVVASRSKTCLNDEVKQQGPDHLINRSCRNAIARNACQFYSNYEDKLKTLDTNQVLDIETLGDWGRNHQCCPYYAAKTIAESKASLNIMPYNYLLDSSKTKGLKLRLQNSIIIIDEAHNVDGVLKDAVSGEFSQSNLKTIVDSCAELPSKLSAAISKERFGLTRNGYDPKEKNSSKKDNDKEKEPNFLEELAAKLTVENIRQVSKCASLLIENNLKLDDIIEPTEVYDLFERLCDVNYRTSDLIISTMDCMDSFWSAAGVMSPIQVAKYVTAIRNLCNFITLLFPQENRNEIQHREHKRNLIEFYKAYCEGLYEKSNVVINYKGELKDWTLKLWCLHAAIGMKKVIDSNCLTKPRSIILTSGTLAPTESIEKELGVPFPIIQNFKHVINQDQFKIVLIGESPDHYSLKSDYEASEEDGYKKAIGKTLLPLFHILPYGTLVFFPSYAQMNKILKYWKEKSSIWSEMNNITNVFVECKLQDTFELEMRNYKSTLAKVNSRAVFFAVCRGKLSEGVNLVGNQCRTLIMTGLPFPSLLDPKIKATKTFQEKKYNDERGKLWYTRQMTRALNQTVGRVIRSKDDHGLLILCSPRFWPYLYNLSDWTAPFRPTDQTRISDVEFLIKKFFGMLGYVITGSITQKVGAFEIGYSRSKKSSQTSTQEAFKSQVENFKVTGQSNATNGNTANIRENLLSQYKVDNKTYERVQSKRAAAGASAQNDSPTEVDNSKKLKLTPNDFMEMIYTTGQTPTLDNPPSSTTTQNQLIDINVPNLSDAWSDFEVPINVVKSQINNHQEELAIETEPPAQIKPSEPKKSINIFKKKKKQENKKKNTQQQLPIGSQSSAIQSCQINYSIYNQLKDPNRPRFWKCYICLNKAEQPHRTNCKCAKVGCLNDLKILDGRRCGKCHVIFRFKEFVELIFKSSFKRNQQFDPDSGKRK